MGSVPISRFSGDRDSERGDEWTSGWGWMCGCRVLDGAITQTRYDDAYGAAWAALKEARVLGN